MTPALFLLVALAGGLGAAARFALDGLVSARTDGSLPWGTITVNLTGSFALGLVTGLAGSHLLPDDVTTVLGAGFLGGYTTFSTASLETVRLLQEGRTTAGVLVGAGTLVTTVVLAGLGLWLGSLG
ncbi:MAG: fluoride efflux transporter CrcB [Acidobacteria bacterium]|nr:MAG: fluoride efflux transporter CrcB [Acidobacteriota bacterium]